MQAIVQVESQLARINTGPHLLESSKPSLFAMVFNDPKMTAKEKLDCINFIYSSVVKLIEKQAQEHVAQMELERAKQVGEKKKNAIYRKYLASKVAGSVLKDFYTVRL